MQPKSASRQQGEDIGMEVRACAKALTDGRQGERREAADCCQIPPAKDTAAFIMANPGLNLPDSLLSCLSYASWLRFPLW